jgi:acetolactate synthase I/II/III large subunit
MGCKGIRVTDMKDLPNAMAEFLETNEPVILDAVVEKHEHVYPMVPAGKALHEVCHHIISIFVLNLSTILIK